MTSKLTGPKTLKQQPDIYFCAAFGFGDSSEQLNIAWSFPLTCAIIGQRPIVLAADVGSQC